MAGAISSKSPPSEDSEPTSLRNHACGPDEADVLDIRGAMTLLKLGRSAIYAACGRGQIPHRRIGKHIRFSRAALIRWLGGDR